MGECFFLIYSQPISYFPYQLESVEWLKARKHAYLALEMGLGKTAISILAAKAIGAKRPYVVCPAVAVPNWHKEFKMHWPEHPKLEVYSYNTACTLTRANPDVLILDEAHYLKSIEAQRTRAILGKNAPLLASKPHIWALSGTPAPNNASELWPLCFVLGFTALRYSEWVETFCDQRTIRLPKRTVHQIAGTKESAIPKLRGVLAPHMLRLLKKDVMKELPPITYETVTVTPCEVDLENDIVFINYVSPKDRRDVLFKKLEEEAAALKTFINNTGVGGVGMRGMASLQLALGTLRRYTGMQKLNAVVELVRSELEANAYEKVVLFAIHQGVIKELMERLRDFGAVTLYGMTPPEKRQRHIEKFQKNPKCRVFIGNIHAAGSAITLTAAHNVIFVEQDWVPGNNAQAAMRCHRIGQEHPVLVRFIALNDSLDERITTALQKKTRQLTKIFDPSEENEETQEPMPEPFPDESAAIDEES